MITITLLLDLCSSTHTRRWVSWHADYLCMEENRDCDTCLQICFRLSDHLSLIKIKLRLFNFVNRRLSITRWNEDQPFSIRHIVE